MRSSKPFVLCWDVEKATIHCLPIMQNLQRSSLWYLIPGRALLLCRTWRPCSLICPRNMCQSLVVSSFSVAAEVSLTIMLSVNLYKFAIHSPLRIVIEPLVTLITPSAIENLYLRAFKRLPTREDFSLNQEYVKPSWGFELVHQTSSCRCCRFRQSYIWNRFPSGLSLHHEACKHWTTLFLCTYGMSTSS